MKGIVLKIVCYVAALASFAKWPETSAFTQQPPIDTLIPTSTTFNPKATACDGFSCPNGTECAIGERQRPVCVCIDTSCPDMTDKVCGTDGRTYDNECKLYKESCTSDTNIQVAYKGFCLEGSVCSGFRQCPKKKICNVNQDNQPVCICDQFCSQEYDPVCGSDGNTYPNLCFLERDACNRRPNLTLVRTGQCNNDGLCFGIVCPPLKTCVLNEKNQTSCACNYHCDNYNYGPVCGPDNKTYDNLCQMVAAFCEANKSIANDYGVFTDYFGVCSEGPNCQGIHCPYLTHCDSLTQAEPKCVCNTYCPKTYSPVCGSNNKTYNNFCELSKDYCLTNYSILFQSNGRCDDGPGCDYTYCPYGQTCLVDERNRPMCVCDLGCYPGSNEVCGTDNKTYSSECVLTAAACLTKKTISVQRNESCKKASPCQGIVCSSDKICEVDRNGKPVCVCNSQCNSYGSSICGSDNKTYDSICQLRKTACNSSFSIRWFNYGRCIEASVCDKISCPPDKRCAFDQRGRPTCACIDECLNVQYPVCGSDGFTYNNECELQKQTCTTNTNVTMIHGGKCVEGSTRHTTDRMTSESRINLSVESVTLTFSSFSISESSTGKTNSALCLCALSKFYLLTASITLLSALRTSK